MQSWRRGFLHYCSTVYSHDQQPGIFWQGDPRCEFLWHNIPKVICWRPYINLVRSPKIFFLVEFLPTPKPFDVGMSMLFQIRLKIANVNLISYSCMMPAFVTPIMSDSHPSTLLLESLIGWLFCQQ